MNISSSDFSYIIPHTAVENDRVEAWFVLKNQGHSLAGSRVEGLNLGFNTQDEESVVARNRLLLFEDLGIDPKWVALADQVHGSRVQVVTDDGTYASTDGLITTLPGLTLAIQVADCAAVLIWDSSSQVIGAFHAGWRGAVAEIIPRGLAMMKRRGAASKSLRAFVSPCISLENFEVGPEVAEQFPSPFVDWDTYHKPHVDLKGFIRNQLRSEGLKDSHIEVSGECTVAGSRDYYSYRREGEESGRMMALIRIKR
ncbi:peptidoglycan editing factor PgeF [Fodinibius sediminis]|uniref:Purine nucleoside phosphorylase n=1 Tax=Fodinibius sediminis TaxID=1214077 RepID=A0A521B299_9BACT|nr:peptidoglycan editing factor PgeF [Fodinibius sediminis]SMO41207.1 conserved hypothetical protein [Fodinibius sediminis]